MALLGYLGYCFLLPFMLGALILRAMLRNPIILALVIVTAIVGLIMDFGSFSSGSTAQSYHHVSDFLGARGLAGLDMSSQAVRDYHKIPVYEEDWVDDVNKVAMPMLDPFGNFLTEFQPYVIGFLVIIIFVGIGVSVRQVTAPPSARRTP